MKAVAVHDWPWRWSFWFARVRISAESPSKRYHSLRVPIKGPVRNTIVQLTQTQLDILVLSTYRSVHLTILGMLLVFCTLAITTTAIMDQDDDSVCLVTLTALQCLPYLHYTQRAIANHSSHVPRKRTLEGQG